MDSLKTYVCTAKNKNGKKCSNKLTSYCSLDYNERRCHIHFLNHNEGTCYECGFECNPCSQLCGRCARRFTMAALGWY